MQNFASMRRRLPLLALAPVLALSACGGDSVPSNGVAKVDDTVITKRTFDHWMQIAAISAQGPQQGAAQPKVSIPQPPEFTECVAQKRTSAPKPAKGQPQP